MVIVLVIIVLSHPHHLSHRCCRPRHHEHPHRHVQGRGQGLGLLALLNCSTNSSYGSRFLFNSLQAYTTSYLRASFAKLINEMV